MMTTMCSAANYAKANMLARTFHMCVDDVKTALFRAYCAPLHTAQLCCSRSKAKMKRPQVTFNDAFRCFQDGQVEVTCLRPVMFPPSMSCQGILCQ